MEYPGYKYLAISVKDRIATVTINRPDKMNACGKEDHAEFPRVLRDLARDKDVRVAIVTGAGRAFSVGGDLDFMEYMNSHPQELPPLLDEARELVNAHIEMEKPIIAAVNGYCMGAGAAFALLCDIIIADKQAKFSAGQIKAAMVPGDGPALIWPVSVGLAKAKRYLLTGDWVPAVEAERIGLITEVVENGQCLTRAYEYAQRLAEGPQMALGYTKRALNQWLKLGMADVFDYSLSLEMMTFMSEDTRKAIANIKAKGPGAIPPEKA